MVRVTRHRVCARATQTTRATRAVLANVCCVLLFCVVFLCVSCCFLVVFLLFCALFSRLFCVLDLLRLFNTTHTVTCPGSPPCSGVRGHCNTTTGAHNTTHTHTHTHTYTHTHTLTHARTGACRCEAGFSGIDCSGGLSLLLFCLFGCVVFRCCFALLVVLWFCSLLLLFSTETKTQAKRTQNTNNSTMFGHGPVFQQRNLR